MKKLTLAISMLLILLSVSGCDKISDTFNLYFKSPEERLAGYVEDIADIVIDADDCDKASAEIDLYTANKKELIKRDVKELLDNADKEGTKDETIEKIKKDMKEVKTRAENSKCISDIDVIGSLAGFTGTVTKILIGSALGSIGDSIMGDENN